MSPPSAGMILGISGMTGITTQISISLVWSTMTIGIGYSQVFIHIVGATMKEMIMVSITEAGV